MVARASYVPDRGDLAWLSLDPARGHEERGRRPVLVVSPKAYNARAGLALVCPVTTAEKGYPFEVRVAAKGVAGVALADQLRAVDWRARRLAKIGRASEADISLVQDLLKKLIAE
jgi:mRNA interferase MazF